MVLLKNGEEVPMTDVLNVYPERRVYALNGKMGAGKTTFTKQLCEELGTMDIVNSPTFAIVNVYEDGQGEEIYHFDCYRLKNLAEAMDLGAEEYLYSGRYCFIEWPDVLEPILPEDTVEITFTVTDNGDRVLRL
ncbi:MAG: tRNA (adenosine(37)-N6)-threonylcarbamoyltransferase complex ATPase subunit type 1 TsaE [Paludibacteraceae bacterium]|nr:tRNA (adenosine(37)-N6)-threonylcarbamoyltransferase complex ATPase subunit type 1 TsaE [Paludibacteraceae bacterium]